MSRQLPALIRPERLERPHRPNGSEVIVIEPAGPPRAMHPLARLALNLTPDLVRAIERSRTRHDTSARATTRGRADQRSYARGIRMSETELDLRLPFVRRVVVRKATAWASDLPMTLIDAAPVKRSSRGARLRRAGILSGGAVALTAATIGLLASRRGDS